MENEFRTYDRDKSIVFLKTNEYFGGLSNMAGGFPLKVNNVQINTAEALYQACRFPHLPDIQKIIIGQSSPMTAKMKSKPYRSESRKDWDEVKVTIMRWVLRIKLLQNWDSFSNILIKTEDKPIVEQSKKDTFWGAKEDINNTLTGQNILGRLLMELRQEIFNNNFSPPLCINPLSIDKFLLLDKEIEVTYPLKNKINIKNQIELNI